MASPVSEVLPDAGPCRWCSHGQWSHKRGRAGCTHPECGGMCDRYAPPKDQPAPASPVPGEVVDAPAEPGPVEQVGGFEPAESGDVDLPVPVPAEPEESHVVFCRPVGFASAIEQDERDALTGVSPVEPVEVVDVVKRRRRKPEPLPGGDPVPDPAAQAEHAEQVAAVDEQLTQPEPEQVGDDELPDWGGPENEWWRGEHQRLSASIERLTTDRDRLAGQLGARLRDLDQAQEQVAQLQRGARVLSAERNEARTELANLRREVVEREEQIARERGARSAELAQLREELARATAARQRLQERVDTAVHTGLTAVSQVIGRYTAHACLNCGARYGLPFTDHGCGPLVPVVVTIARADRPGPNTSKG
ncbi:hypothetical protein [Micromonospora aurantiaca (nom. illeg.)]|uniref:hypothetical protein n=1 Tax=Micromonospora aurantiaca (nom. illeg.) TaxID=47850 RepID=UPI0033E362AE